MVRRAVATGLFISLVAAIVLVANAAAPQTRVNSNPLVPTNQSNPAVSGSKIVWADNRASSSDIYVKDILTGIESPVCTAPGAQYSPAISGNRVVWQDDRNGNMDIYMKDLASGLESVICTAPGDQKLPDIDGSRIVWQDGRFDVPDTHWSDIYMKDLVTREESIIANEVTGEAKPTISGDLVAWERWSRVWSHGQYKSNCRIFWKDLKTGARQGFAEGYQNQPDISANVLVYYEIVFDADDNPIATRIVIVNVRTAEAELISDSTRSKDDPRISSGNVVWGEYDSSSATYNILSKRAFGGAPPATVVSKTTWVGAQAVDDTRVAWTDHRGGSRDSDVYAKVPGGVEQLVTTNDMVPSSQTWPVMDGNRIVWGDNRSESTSLFTKNLATGREEPVIAGNPMILLPDISGDVIAYWEIGSGRYMIKTKNMATGLITSVRDPGNRTCFFPAISGNLVVWNDTRNGNADIYMKNLSTSVESTVCTNTAQQYFPDISGQKVVWEDSRNSTSTGTDIYARDMSTRVESAVVTATGNQADPAISGNIVVWQDFRSDADGDIWTRNLTTGLASNLTNNTAAQEQPAVDGNVVVWIDKRAGYLTLRARNIAAGVERDIVSDPRAKPERPQVSGNRITWQDYREGNDVIPDANVYTTSADFVAPVTTVTTPVYSTDQTTGAKFVVSWSATDVTPTAGLACYDVQYRVSSSATWTTWKDDVVTGSAVFAGAPGNTYRFRGRTKDKAGNLGSWSAEKMTVVPYDHGKASYVTTSAWGTQTSAQLFGGSSRYTSGTGRYATYNFAGARSVALILTRRPTGGNLNVYINNVLVKSTTCYGATTRYRVPVVVKGYAMLANGTLKIVATGTKPTGSTGTRVELDGIAIGR